MWLIPSPSYATRLHTSPRTRTQVKVAKSTQNKETAEYGMRGNNISTYESEISESYVIKLLMLSRSANSFEGYFKVPSSVSSVPLSATVRPRSASSCARCSSACSCFFCRRFEPIPLPNFLSPFVSPSSSWPLILSIALSTDCRTLWCLSLSTLFKEADVDSRPFLSRFKVFEKMCDSPFRDGELDFSLIVSGERSR